MNSKKTVLITGAAGNLGQAFTTVFGRAGYAVAGIDLDDALLEKFSTAASDVGADHLALPCDLKEWDQIEAAVEAAAGHFGRIDVVINNATARTTPTIKPLEECTAAEIDTLFSVGPQAALGVMRAALPHLKKVGGSVINIGSGAGTSGPVGLGPYGMSKAALNLLTRSAAKEWGPYGVRVNGILPKVMTAQLERVMETVKVKMPPLGRIGDSEKDVGAVALFLASPAADYITGENIAVDGGSGLG